MRIANPGAVYRSTTPEVHLATVRANEAARVQAVAAMEALANSLVPGSVPYGTNTDDDSFTMRGLLVDGVVRIEAPAGLRWDTKARRGARVLVPAKKTAEGQALAKRFAEVSYAAKPLGWVSRILTISDGSGRSWFSQACIEVIGDDVYATYFQPLDERSAAGVAGDTDWVRVERLSEFYAAREAHAASVEAGADA